MEQLPPQLLQAVPHVTFGLFNLAIPNIIAWLAVILIFIAAIWVRLPDVFAPASDA